VTVTESTTTVDGADLDQSQTIDAVTLTQQHQLTAQDVDQGQTVGNVTLTQQHVLTANDVDQGQTVDGVTLTQAYILTAADIDQGQTTDNATLTQAYVITAADIDQAQVLDATFVFLGSGALLPLYDRIIIGDGTVQYRLDDGTVYQWIANSTTSIRIN